MAAPTTVSHAGTITGQDLTYCVVRDVARSTAFYRDILGLKPTLEDPSGTEFELADGTTFGVWNPGAGEEVKPHAGVMFAVPDAKAAVAAIRERGGTVSDVDETPVCFMAFGDDPDGIGFVIHQRKPGHL
ncbi:MAG: VOC family protein [Candidatus Velthaea sp.]|jgi:predicted enzyme related to lactoylglutathione lyase